MITYRVGCTGPEVRQIQAALQQLKLYLGPIDGIFGGGTEAAVRAFQNGNHLTIDGIIGPKTWAALIPNTAPPTPAITTKSIGERCLALTGGFETNAPPPDCFAGLSGNFDGMGLSFGALQWNLGQSTLQPILRNFDQANPGATSSIFGDYISEFRSMLASTRDDQMAWAASIQNAKFVVAEPWCGYFKTLGRDSQFILAQTQAAADVERRALNLCKQLQITSQRALALAFDILTQNGSISDPTLKSIERDVQSLSSQLSVDQLEQAKLEIIANRCADAASPRWREDVRTRKLTIALGVGKVHGRYYDLSGQYGLTLAAM